MFPVFNWASAGQWEGEGKKYLIVWSQALTYIATTSGLWMFHITSCVLGHGSYNHRIVFRIEQDLCSFLNLKELLPSSSLLAGDCVSVSLEESPALLYSLQTSEKQVIFSLSSLFHA